MFFVMHLCRSEWFQSEKLKDAVYQLPWQCMDVKNRKIVLFFLMNVQTPVHVKAMGLTRVGVDTMAAVTTIFDLVIL